MERIDADHFLKVHFGFMRIAQDRSQIIVRTFMTWPQAVRLNEKTG